MNTSTTRVTRAQAAELAGVSQRQVSRWAAAGLLTAEYGPIGARVPATYDPAEGMQAKLTWEGGARAGRPRAAETDIKT